MICHKLRHHLLVKHLPVKNVNHYSSSLSGSGTAERKRFYKSVSIVQNDGKYEINLDSRKLKTPLGSIFYVHNRPLALMVANEWSSQSRVIRMSNMHLTQLANTAIDNPGHDTHQTLTDRILEFIDSDAICFRQEYPEDLCQLQLKSWDPLVKWFEQCFDCRIPITQTVHLPPIDDRTKQVISRHLLSHNHWSLIGLKFATENLKSLILSLALSQHHLTADQCVDVSRLEEDYGIQKWGRLVATHDLEMYALKARVSAAALFYFTNCENRHLQQKGGQSMTETVGQSVG